jgi:hypothetical protein
LHSNEAPLWILLRQKKGFKKRLLISKKLQEIHNQMARVRSTARVERDGDETEATETVPISEAMRRSGLVSSEDTPAAKATQLTLKKMRLKMSMVQCHLNPATWSLGSLLLPKVIWLSY